METFDTNVLVRLVVQDDADQCARAERSWRSAVGSSGVFLPVVALVELVWVLRVAYKLDRTSVAATLRRLMSSEGVTLEREDVLHAALDRYAVGLADFSDYVILETGRSVGAVPLRTFDARLAQTAEVELVP